MLLDNLTNVFLAAFLVFFATSFGSLLILPVSRKDDKMKIVFISFAAGVMTAAIFEMLNTIRTGADLSTLLAFFAGICFIAIADMVFPHLHSIMRKEPLEKSAKKTALIVTTVAIHNIPEGFAVASAFAHSLVLGWLIALSIAIQDIPEGLMVSAPLYSYGLKRRIAIPLGFLSGLFEGLAVAAGYLLLYQISHLTPLALSLSSGAMAYLVFAELLPDAFAEKKHQTAAAASFFAGLAMPFLISFLVAL